MKNKFFFPLFCLLVLSVFAACSEDDEQKGISYLDLSKQSLTLTEGAATASTFTFSVEASDATIPYLCLYVDKAVIDNVSKGELPGYLMDDLKKQAEAADKTFEEYIASIALTGNQTDVKITNLLPGRIYELVAFAVDGTRIAEQAEYLFFQTEMADRIECSFEVTSTPTATGASFDVKPSNKETDYYFCTFTKNQYTQLQNGGMDDEMIVNAFFESQVNALLEQLAPDGVITQEIIDEVLSKTLFKGDQKLSVNGQLIPETEYVWMAAAFAIVQDGNTTSFVINSQPSKGEYVTDNKEEEDLGTMNFDIQVTDITATRAHIKITPEEMERPYIWTYQAYNDETAGMTALELAQNFVASQGPFIGFVVTQGAQDVPNGTLTVGKKHYVVAFGFDRNTRQITSNPQLYEFDAPGSEADPAQVEFEAVPASYLMTPYTTAVDVYPSDETVPYVVMMVPDGTYTEEECRLWLEVLVNNDFQQNLQINSSLTWQTFLYDNVSYRPGNRYGTGYAFVDPETSCTLCCASLTSEGKVAALQMLEGVVKTPALSEATVTAEYLGCFDGDEEAGTIFGNASATAGRVIVAMKYTPSEGSTNANFLLADALYNQLTDKELLTDFMWNPVNLQSNGYAFVICDWNTAYTSFAYSKLNNHEGKIARLDIGMLAKANAGTIDELEDIIAQAEASSSASKLNRVSVRRAEEKTAMSALQMPFRPADFNPVQRPEGVRSVLGVQRQLPLAHPVKK